MEFSPLTQGVTWIKKSGDNDYHIIYYDSDKMVGINIINTKTNVSVRTNVVWSFEEFLIDLNKEFPNELRKRKIDNLL